MKKVDISSMFLVPKNIYTSMLSHINEDDIKEELKLLNRQRDDGNYIEKAINFNQQQERQKNQIILKPPVGNETIRTDANTNANTSVYTSNLNRTLANTAPPSMNQTMQGVTSTPMREQAVSRKPSLPVVLEETLLDPDLDGKYFCKFCKDDTEYANREELQNHLLKKHEVDMNREEHASVLQDPENVTSQQSGFYTPSNTIGMTLDKTGAKSKQKNTQGPVTSTPNNQNVVASGSANKTGSGKRKREGREKSGDDDSDEDKLDVTEISKRQTKGRLNEREYELTGLTMRPGQSMYGRPTMQIFTKKPNE